MRGHAKAWSRNASERCPQQVVPRSPQVAGASGSGELQPATERNLHEQRQHNRSRLTKSAGASAMTSSGPAPDLARDCSCLPQFCLANRLLHRGEQHTPPALSPGERCVRIAWDGRQPSTRMRARLRAQHRTGSRKHQGLQQVVAVEKVASNYATHGTAIRVSTHRTRGLVPRASSSQAGGSLQPEQ